MWSRNWLTADGSARGLYAGGCQRQGCRYNDEKAPPRVSFSAGSVWLVPIVRHLYSLTILNRRRVRRRPLDLLSCALEQGRYGQAQLNRFRADVRVLRS